MITETPRISSFPTRSTRCKPAALLLTGALWLLAPVAASGATIVSTPADAGNRTARGYVTSTAGDIATGGFTARWGDDTGFGSCVFIFFCRAELRELDGKHFVACWEAGEQS